MVFNYTDEELEDITKRINFVLTEYENYIIEALHRYFACLKELKVTGPFFIGVSLLRIRKFRLMVRDSPVHSSTIRESDPENIQTDLLAVPADADTSKVDVIATIMKRPFRQIWRGFHMVGRPNFADDGTWFSYDEGAL